LIETLLMVQKSGDHHLGCIMMYKTRPKYWDGLPTNWCRIFSINSMIDPLQYCPIPGPTESFLLEEYASNGYSWKQDSERVKSGFKLSLKLEVTPCCSQGLDLEFMWY